MSRAITRVGAVAVVVCSLSCATVPTGSAKPMVAETGPEVAERQRLLELRSHPRAVPVSERIGPKDRVRIVVKNLDEPSRTYNVGPNGTLAVPLVGDLKVEGNTPQEVEQNLAERLKSILVNPNVRVTRVEPSPGKVIVNGAIQEPGVVNLGKIKTLADVILFAGGPTSNASGTVRLIPSPAEEAKGLVAEAQGAGSILELPIDNVLGSAGKKAPPIYLWAGDVIEVVARLDSGAPAPIASADTAGEKSSDHKAAKVAAEPPPPLAVSAAPAPPPAAPAERPQGGFVEINKDSGEIEAAKPREAPFPPTLQAKTEATQQPMTVLGEARRALEKGVAEIQVRDREIAEQRKEIAQLKAAQEKEIKRREEQLDATRAQITELEKTHQAADRKGRAEVEKLQAMLNDLDGRFIRSKEENKAATAENERLRREQEAVVAKLAQQERAFSEEARKREQALQQRAHDLEVANRLVEETRKAFRERLAVVESLDSQIKNLKEEHERELARKEQELRDRTNEIVALKAEKESIAGRGVKENAALGQKYDRQVGELQAQLTRLQEDLGREREGSQRLRTEITHIETERAKVREEIGKLERVSGQTERAPSTIAPPESRKERTQRRGKRTRGRQSRPADEEPGAGAGADPDAPLDESSAEDLPTSRTVNAGADALLR